MTYFIKTTPFETEQIARMMEAGEFIVPAIHRVAIISTESVDGSIIVRHMTNDDNDDGYPDGQWTTWAENFNDLESAQDNVGKCRIGISGVIVSVSLDGKEIR